MSNSEKKYAKKIVYLSEAQYQQLVINQTITVNGVTINYDENTLYMTPQNVSEKKVNNAVSYAEQQTISNEGKIIARENIGAASTDDIGVLNERFNDMSKWDETIYIPDNLNFIANGLTIQKENDNIKIYGTATASQRICFLNGQQSAKYTYSLFDKTLDAGTYLIEAQATGTFTNFRFVGTYTTFNDLMWVVTYNQPSTTITFTDPVMIGLLVVEGNNFGTEVNPTYINFSAKQLTAVDLIARNEINEVKNSSQYIPQLKTSINDIFNAITKENDSLIWEIGNINASNGNNFDTNNRIRTTRAINITPYINITVPEGAWVSLRPYKSDGTFVGYGTTKFTGTFNLMSNINSWLNQHIDVTMIRFCAGFSDDSVISDINDIIIDISHKEIVNVVELEKQLKNKINYAESEIDTTLFPIERLSNGDYYSFTTNSGIYKETGFFLSSAKYFRTQFLEYNDAKALICTLGLADYKWTSWSYQNANVSNSQPIHSNTNSDYIDCTQPLYIQKTVSDDNYFVIVFARNDGANMTTSDSDVNSDYYKIQHALKIYMHMGTDKTLTIADRPADAKETGNKLNNIQSSGFIDCLNGNRKLKTYKGITYNWDDSGHVCYLYGTASETEVSFDNIFNKTFLSGEKHIYYLQIESDIELTDDFSIALWTRTGERALTTKSYEKKSRLFSIDDTITQLLLRINIKPGITVDGHITVYMFELSGFIDTTKNIYTCSYPYNLPSCDLDTIKENGRWLLADSEVYEHTPGQLTVGYLRVEKYGNAYYVQTYMSISGQSVYTRVKRSTESAWREWRELGSGGGDAYNITNEYVTNHYENTLNATVTPQITTDTNQYLQSSRDNTDRKAVIETLLASTGVCRLGPGDFYVSGIDMPEHTAIIGSGDKTRVILLGTGADEGYAIHMNNDCTVRDMGILGSDTEITIGSYNYVNRHGILFEATYDTDQSTKRRCIVDGCRIRYFTGGGVTCYNTGFPVNSTLMVSNTFIFACTVGINIPYWSEFNIFTSCHVRACYYGSVNNGGNNLFSACNFSANKVGMLCDNSQQQSPNNTHGSVVACIFDHEDSNNGIGIKMDGCHAGEVFSDCQLFFADIEVNNCTGVQFNNFNAGSNVDITVTKGQEGGLIMFNNWIFKPGYRITIEEGYDECKFVNCWTRDGMAVTS